MLPFAVGRFLFHVIHDFLHSLGFCLLGPTVRRTNSADLTKELPINVKPYLSFALNKYMDENIRKNQERERKNVWQRREKKPALALRARLYECVQLKRNIYCIPFVLITVYCDRHKSLLNEIQSNVFWHLLSASLSFSFLVISALCPRDDNVSIHYCRKLHPVLRPTQHIK